MNSASLKAEYTGSWALIIGIDSYSHLSPLQAAVNDAAAIAKVLKDKFGFAENQTLYLLNNWGKG